MKRPVSLRDATLAGGSVGALAGGVFAHVAASAQPLVPVFVGFALGQVAAVVVARLLAQRATARTDAPP